MAEPPNFIGNSTAIVEASNICAPNHAIPTLHRLSSSSDVSFSTCDVADIGAVTVGHGNGASFYCDMRPSMHRYAVAQRGPGMSGAVRVGETTIGARRMTVRRVSANFTSY